MPHTTRVRAQLARYLLRYGNADLRRRIAILRGTPYPPGSHSLAASEDWQRLQQSFPHHRAFVYGDADSAVIFTYEATSNVVSIVFAIVGGEIVGKDD